MISTSSTSDLLISTSSTSDLLISTSSTSDLLIFYVVYFRFVVIGKGLKCVCMWGNGLSNTCVLLSVNYNNDNITACSISFQARLKMKTRNTRIKR